jgi:hypothetical protein
VSLYETYVEDRYPFLLTGGMRGLGERVRVTWSAERIAEVA